MKPVVLLLVAIALIILGARGTYKAVWNQYFPGEPIVTTPVATGSPATAVPAAAGTAGNPAGSAPITQTPNVTSRGGSTSPGAIQPGQKITRVAGGGGVYPNQTVDAAGGGAPIRIPASNAPAWWPSWAPYPGDNPLSGWG